MKLETSPSFKEHGGEWTEPGIRNLLKLDEIVKDVVERLVHAEEAVKIFETNQLRSNLTNIFDICDKIFQAKKILKEHKKENHKQKIKGKYCDENSTEYRKLEIHFRNHAEASLFKCDKFSKDIHLHTNNSIYIMSTQCKRISL